MKKKSARRFLQRNQHKLGARRIAETKGSLERREEKAKKALKKKGKR